ncbi:MAG: hypothetical protein KAT68_11900 [Bacteroidales bacterium]|nr:hypothetical protein [Bacteroidales bacterium]
MINSMIIEFENIYKRSTSSDFSFLDEFGIPYSELTTLLLIFDYCTYDKVNSVNYFIHTYNQIESEKVIQLKSHLLKFIDFYITNINNPIISDFIELASRTYLNNYKNKFTDKYKLPFLPKNNVVNSIYLDLVTGFEFNNFFNQLDENTDYYLVDKSIFSCKCLELKAKDSNLKNVFIINKDVLDLETSDFKKPIGLIRAKNIFKYVPLFLLKLPFLKNVLSTNGHFIFQERSKDNIIFNRNTNYYRIKDLFQDGWECIEKRGDASNPLELDTLTFTKKAKNHTG